MISASKRRIVNFFTTLCLGSKGHYRLVCYVFYMLRALFRDLREGQLDLRAMGLVYTTLLSIVPLLALSFSILKGFGVHQKMEPILQQLLEPLGNKGAEISHQIVSFVNNIDIGVLGATGLLVLLYTVISLMKKIEEAINFTWRLKKTRNLAHRFSHYFSLLLIGPILMFSAIGLWAAFLDTSAMHYVTTTYGVVTTLLTSYLPKILIIIAFLFVYILIPNTKVKLKAALGGAVVAGLLWHAGSWGFASFVSNSSKQTAIYSAFASMMFFMIWMYLSWLFLLIGASIAYYLQHPQSVYFSAKALPLSPRLKLTLAVAIMQKTYEQASLRKAPLNARELSEQLFIHEPMINQVLKPLIEHRIVLADSSKPPKYSAYIPRSELTLQDIKQVIETGIREQITNTDRAYRSNADLIKLDIQLAQLSSADTSTLVNTISKK